MSGQPLTPRPDGKCVDCVRSFTDTRDRLFCRSCLRKRLNRDCYAPSRGPKRVRGTDAREGTRETKEGRDPWGSS